MNTTSIRPLLAMSIAALLSACGGGVEQTPTVHTAAMVETSLYASQSGTGPAQATGSQLPVAQLPAAQAAQAASVQAAQAAALAAAAQGPQPDCAADGCKAIRIIDSNAEMYRLDAQRRAAVDDDAPPSA
jgi:hypothetical protein